MQIQLNLMMKKINIKQENDDEEEKQDENITKASGGTNDINILEWKQYISEREKEHDLYRENMQKQMEILKTENITNRCT